MIRKSVKAISDWMTHKFNKRIFTAGKVASDLWFLVSQAPQIAGLMRSKKIDRAFTERIMTVVTAVNGCTYCTWFHARQASEAGISEEEVRKLLELQFDTGASEFELPALFFAQHYTETNRHPDDAMTKRLIDFYGDETSQHVMLVIRMIFFGNLLGNTFDAFLSRLRGNPASDSSPFFETVFFLFTAWFMLPALVLTRGSELRNPRR